MTTNTTTASGTTTTTNGSPNGKNSRAPMTAIDAAGKIKKILDQLSPAEQKRVLAFVSVDDPE